MTRLMMSDAAVTTAPPVTWKKKALQTCSGRIQMMSVNDLVEKCRIWLSCAFIFFSFFFCIFVNLFITVFLWKTGPFLVHDMFESNWKLSLNRLSAISPCPLLGPAPHFGTTLTCACVCLCEIASHRFPSRFVQDVERVVDIGIRGGERSQAADTADHWHVLVHQWCHPLAVHVAAVAIVTWQWAHVDRWALFFIKVIILIKQL